MKKKVTEEVFDDPLDPTKGNIEFGKKVKDEKKKEGEAAMPFPQP